MSSQASRKSSLFVSGPVIIATVACIAMGLSTPAARRADLNSAASLLSPREQALDNAAIINLKKLGFGDDVLLEKIKTSRRNFGVGVKGLKQFKAQSLSDAVVATMISAAGDQVARFSSDYGSSKAQLVKTSPGRFECFEVLTGACRTVPEKPKRRDQSGKHSSSALAGSSGLAIHSERHTA